MVGSREPVTLLQVDGPQEETMFGAGVYVDEHGASLHEDVTCSVPRQGHADVGRYKNGHATTSLCCAVLP
eukprot:5909864-Pyramimonas_sp.AAC.1